MSEPNGKMPPAMILCGGLGTRIRDVTELLPKPMVTVGPYPMIWHIMKGYAAFGVRRFILCLGYKRETFVDFFLNYRAHMSDITVQLGDNATVTYHNPSDEDWEVTLADTGLKTMTGNRVFGAAKYLKGSDKEFFLTYGDGLANVDVCALLESHHRQGKSITVTAVHPAGRFGEMQIGPEGTVHGFHEKPQTESGFINGGFMVLSRSFVDNFLTNDPHLVLEESPMRQAAKQGRMAAFEHNGFWQCMDTAREHQLLSALWESGEAPWTERW